MMPCAVTDMEMCDFRHNAETMPVRHAHHRGSNSDDVASRQMFWNVPQAF